MPVLSRLLLVALAALALVACGPAGEPSGDGGYADASAPDSRDPYDDPANRTPETPIEAPRDEWTWVPFRDAVCANGRSTGLAVNLTNRSDRVLVFMMGGGACWDALTCYWVKTAANVLTGYDAASWERDRARLAAAPFFDRANPANPFRDASLVFVPYCTGDVHAGRAVRSYFTQLGRFTTYFMGARNIEVYLRRLVPTFRAASRVWLAGSSAGGFGAAINWGPVQAAFGATRVDLLDDSGPPLDVPARWNLWRTAWNVALPEGCPACGASPGAVLEHYIARYGEGRRFALLSTDRDAVISKFFGLDGPRFEERLGAAMQQLGARTPMRFFVRPGTSHTLLPTLPDERAADGTALTAWLAQFASDDPAWQTVRP